MNPPIPYQPAENLANRTFVGLIIAQFLAGFNDQAIHAAAMFYAMHTKILSQANAITMMPILFYAPWALFCTLSGYYADRYSKTLTLRIWKLSEILISLSLMLGLYLGSDADMPRLGTWIVMSCVFMMGTHAAFFAPAKYGAMPEILRPDILSRGNGILESTTFLASILGTVAGGLLFHFFRDNQIWIGVVLLALSVIGAAASFMIVWLPPANPGKLFPTNLVKPLVENLKLMLRSRPLALSMLGIAFFIFVVAYMRASMYMHGETRNPRWTEEKTSLIVATVALGVGLGSPLAGYVSGSKIELGLVPLGCLGMIFALFTAALAIEQTTILVVALIIIGFFSGFYMVPLYTLLQQRAPKKSKGEFIATSNFINVTGAIAASLLFNVLVQLSRVSGLTPEIPTVDPAIIKGKPALGELKEVDYNQHGKIVRVEIQTEKDGKLIFRAKGQGKFAEEDLLDIWSRSWDLELDDRVISFDDNLFDVLSGTMQKGDNVIVSSYKQSGVQHYLIRRADQPLRKIYDNEVLPRYLFLGAALMTLGILFLLQSKLPDFFVRALFWLRSLGKFRIKVVGMDRLPDEGPVILVTNCKDLMGCLQLVSATDRSTKIILVDNGTALQGGPVLRSMARRYVIIPVHPSKGESSWTSARESALKTLQGGHLLAIGVENDSQASAIEAFVQELRQQTNAPLLPVYCGPLDDNVTSGESLRIRVVFGELMTLPAVAPESTALADCKKAIHDLREWIRNNDDVAGSDHH